MRLDKVKIAVFMKETYHLLLEGRRLEAAATQKGELAHVTE